MYNIVLEMRKSNSNYLGKICEQCWEIAAFLEC